MSACGNDQSFALLCCGVNCLTRIVLVQLTVKPYVHFPLHVVCTDEVTLGVSYGLSSLANLQLTRRPRVVQLLSGILGSTLPKHVCTYRGFALFVWQCCHLWRMRTSTALSCGKLQDLPVYSQPANSPGIPHYPQYSECIDISDTDTDGYWSDVSTCSERGDGWSRACRCCLCGRSIPGASKRVVFRGSNAPHLGTQAGWSTHARVVSRTCTSRASRSTCSEIANTRVFFPPQVRVAVRFTSAFALTAAHPSCNTKQGTVQCALKPSNGQL